MYRIVVTCVHHEHALRVGPGEGGQQSEKHRISFETALRVFADPLAISDKERVENGEERWQTLGMVGGSLLLVVVHTLREEDENGLPVEVIRIISAREADRREKRRYE